MYYHLQGTRTYDWMVMAVRLAGFEIRDMIAWLYGQGFLNQRIYLYKLIRNSVQWDIGEKHTKHMLWELAEQKMVKNWKFQTR